MRLQEILTAAGRHKRSKRDGRGRGSGRGKTSGRGHKGYGQRSGSKARAGFEGGQNPMVRRIPKRGFNNSDFAETVQIVNVGDLDRIFADGAEVTVEALAEAGLVDRLDLAVKLLGKGELGRKLTVRATRASKKAAEKVAAAGGAVELVSG